MTEFSWKYCQQSKEDQQTITTIYQYKKYKFSKLQTRITFSCNYLFSEKKKKIIPVHSHHQHFDGMNIPNLVLASRVSTIVEMDQPLHSNNIISLLEY